MCSWVERFDTEIIDVLYKFIYGHLIEEHVKSDKHIQGFSPHESLGTANQITSECVPYLWEMLTLKTLLKPKINKSGSNGAISHRDENS